MAIGAPAYRRTIERRAAASMKALRRKRSKTNQTKRNTRERHHDICKPNARRIQFRATCGYSTRASEPARVRLLWAILSLVLPVTFGHTAACRSPALAFAAAIHFAMKCSAPCSAVLRHSPSSWAAVIHWSALMPKGSEVVQETPHPLFFLALHTARAPHQFSEHHALRQSRILHARHKSREQDPPPA